MGSIHRRIHLSSLSLLSARRTSSLIHISRIIYLDRELESRAPHQLSTTISVLSLPILSSDVIVHAFTLVSDLQKIIFYAQEISKVIIGCT